MLAAFAADPGLVNTEIGLKSNSFLARWIWDLRRRGGITPRNQQKASSFLQLNRRFRMQLEIYWKHGRPKSPSRYALDPEAAGQLWKLSAQMCGIRQLRQVNMSEKTATRGLILEAVVTCIEKYGIDKLTTRNIAAEAGTNIASINYHFRSKDEFLAEALSMTINHMLEDVFVAIDDLQQPFEKALTIRVLLLLDGNRRFPGVSRAHLYKAVMQQDYASISAHAMVRVFDRLAQRAIREYPAKNPRQLRLTISQILSSIMFSLLAPDFLPVAREYRLTSAKNARRLAASYTSIFRAML